MPERSCGTLIGHAHEIGGAEFRNGVICDEELLDAEMLKATPVRRGRGFCPRLVFIGPAGIQSGRPAPLPVTTQIADMTTNRILAFPERAAAFRPPTAVVPFGS